MEGETQVGLLPLAHGCRITEVVVVLAAVGVGVVSVVVSVRRFTRY